MEINEFRAIFKIASDQIVNVGIKLGYIREDKKDELYAKLNEYLQNEIFYDLPGETAEFNPNNHTMSFNISVFKNKEQALITVLHEMKHILDYYLDENRGYYDILKDHIGLQDKDGKGIGQNESSTERFATDVAEVILEKKVPVKKIDIIGLQLESNLCFYHIEDTLNEIFCNAIGLSRGELLQIQNETELTNLKTVANKFNQHANYNKFRGIMDEIYNAIYRGTDSLYDTIYDSELSNVQGRGTLRKQDFNGYDQETLRKIERVHKLIQIAQKELYSYVSHTKPNMLQDIENKFIKTLPEYQLTKDDEIEYETKYPKIDELYAEKNQSNVHDNSLQDIFSMLREEQEDIIEEVGIDDFKSVAESSIEEKVNTFNDLRTAIKEREQEEKSYEGQGD